jgi:hypothetical protein
MANTDPSAPAASVGVTMAGFIAWLAYHHPSREDRRRCPEEVERFLRWQHHRRAQGLPHHDEAYYAYIRNAGAGDVLVDETRNAIDRLHEYLRTTS